MCLQCPAHRPNQESEQSKDELWTLFRTAYEQYQSEIVGSGKLYDRYVNDLVSYHLPVFSFDEKIVRRHFQNVFTLFELLTNRDDLVRKYFSQPTFEEPDFVDMLYAFNHVQALVDSDPRILASFNKCQIRLVTKFVNESNFFVNAVDEETMDKFFHCSLTEPLVVRNMRYVLQFMYALSQEKMIPHKWASMIARNKMLAPERSMKPSTSGAISSRLSELKLSTRCFPEKSYVELVRQLIEMQ